MPSMNMNMSREKKHDINEDTQAQNISDNEWSIATKILSIQKFNRIYKRNQSPDCEKNKNQIKKG